MSTDTARLIASLELQDKNFTRGLKNAEKRLGKIDKKLSAFGGAVNRNVARGIDTLITKGIDAGQAVIQAAIDQESAIVGISKTVNGNIDAIVDDLKRLSVETGSTFGELAAIAETGGAMGIAKEDLVAFTEQVAILGATTNVSVDDAATSIGQLKTVLGFTGDEFDNFASALVYLGNKGNSTEAQILEITKRTGAAAKTIGLTTDKTLAWASAAANLGLSQEIAGTAISKLFVGTQKIVARGGDDLKDMGKIVGMTGKQFKKAFDRDASGALFSFIKGLKGLSKEQRVLAIEDLFGKGDAMTKTLLGLSEALDDPTSGLTASLKNADEAWEDGGKAQEEADKRFKSSEFAFKRLNNAVNLAAATIGTELLPVLVELAEEGIEWLMQPKTQKAIKSFAVDLGKGLRSVARIVKGIDWSGLAGALTTIAGIGKTLVQAFLGMPAWAQAVLIGGVAVNKLSGGALGSIVTDIFKAKLGITAGTVFLTGKSVVGAGGAPVAGGAAGKGGGIFGGLGKLGVVGGALKVVGTVAIIGAALVLWQKVADDFGQLQTWIKGEQGKLDDLIEGTSTQDFDTTLKNLNATVKGWETMNPLQQLLSPLVAGGQYTKDFEMAADRIRTAFEKGELSKADMQRAVAALEAAQTLMPEFIETPKTDAILEDIKAALAKPPPIQKPRGGQRQPPGTGARQPEGPRRQFGPLKPDPFIKNQFKEIGALKERQEATKTAVTTLNTTADTGLTTLNSSTTAQTTAAAAQSSSQILATSGVNTTTRTGLANTSTAARIAGLTASAAMSQAATRIVGAVNGLDLSVNVTTVNRTSTVNNRYGPSGGSSGYQRVNGAG